MNRNNEPRLADALSWKELYGAAALETKMEVVPLRVREARKAVVERAIQVIRRTPDYEFEVLDLAYAKRVLDELNNQVSVREMPQTSAQSTSGSQVSITQEMSS